jgi:hypothetical protein
MVSCPRKAKLVLPRKRAIECLDEVYESQASLEDILSVHIGCRDVGFVSNDRKTI